MKSPYNSIYKWHVDSREPPMQSIFNLKVEGNLIQWHVDFLYGFIESDSFHSEVEDKLNGRFPGIYMSLVDGVIRDLLRGEKKKIKCSLSSLQEREPYGCKATYK